MKGPSLTAALADRYRIERELGQGGMACRSVAEATTRLLSLKRRGVGLGSAADRQPVKRAEPDA